MVSFGPGGFVLPFPSLPSWNVLGKRENSLETKRNTRPLEPGSGAAHRETAGAPMIHRPLLLVQAALHGASNPSGREVSLPSTQAPPGPTRPLRLGTLLCPHVTYLQQQRRQTFLLLELCSSLGLCRDDLLPRASTPSQPLGGWAQSCITCWQLPLPQRATSPACSPPGATA